MQSFLTQSSDSCQGCSEWQLYRKIYDSSSDDDDNDNDNDAYDNDNDNDDDAYDDDDDDDDDDETNSPVLLSSKKWISCMMIE